MWLICAVLHVIWLWHSVQYLLMTRWISYLLHGEYLVYCTVNTLFIARSISACCTMGICLWHVEYLCVEYLLFIARWISVAPIVISWLSYDSRDVISIWWRQIWRKCMIYRNYCDVISVWWRQIWRRYGQYGSYGTVWYELSCVCIVL